MNPYSNLPPHQFWRRSVENVERHAFNPVVSPKFSLSETDKVATAGSCFAQHISRKLGEIGFNYFVPEHGNELAEDERKARNYGVFSARFGNIYTVRQLIQLFDEAFGDGARPDLSWQRRDGRFVDPYRPNIEPEGFLSLDDVSEARHVHLRYVREMFTQADVFIFTLGLTESWCHKDSGAVFPLAPGVVAGEFSEEFYGFINFNVSEVTNDLHLFLDRLKEVNPSIKVLLTVSPVPLIATYEPKHVLVSTTYSKSVLRVAAEDASRQFSWVDYFPSYEIITGSYNFGMYYCEDAREVNPLGVSHAMRTFVNSYISKDIDETGNKNMASRIDGNGPSVFGKKTTDIICDEEQINQVSV
ncbi:GSCFA domain-containing protein [Azospirillum brasilense]|nr:GSCFA domain-containing protein [Azospirillum brasilense]